MSLALIRKFIMSNVIRFRDFFQCTKEFELLVEEDDGNEDEFSGYMQGNVDRALGNARPFLFFDVLTEATKIRMADVKALLQERKKQGRVVSIVVLSLMAIFVATLWVMFSAMDNGLKAFVPICAPACFSMRERLLVASGRFNETCCGNGTIANDFLKAVPAKSAHVLSNTSGKTLSIANNSANELSHISALMLYCIEDVFIPVYMMEQESAGWQVKLVQMNSSPQPSSSSYSERDKFASNDYNRHMSHSIGYPSVCNKSSIEICQGALHQITKLPDIKACIDYHILGKTISLHFVVFIMLFIAAYLLIIGLMVLINVMFIHFGIKAPQKTPGDT